MDEFNFAPEQPQEEPSRQPDTFTCQPQPMPEPEPKKRNTGLRTAALALCFSLIGGAIGAGGALAVRELLDDEKDSVSATEKNQSQSGTNSSVILEGIREDSVIDFVELETGKQMTAAEVYAANVNSTVGITTSVTTNFWGYQSTSAASGSGFIISQDGYILTNYHVIEDSDSVTVSLYNGDSYDADVVGYDQSNDIAVLKVEAEGLSPVVLGDSDNMNVGDSVLAIGNPLGELTFSLTAGTVSAKDREVTFSNNVTMNLIQTDCAINSGNSGGALFNLYGEVIGVTNAKYSGSSGSSASIDNIGFAIPINSIRDIVESIIEKGYISKPYAGVSVLDVSEEYQIYGLPQGAAIQSVVEDSPAEEAGLQVGDIITAVNGSEITGGTELVNRVAEAEVGEKLTLTVYRRGQTLEITLTVGEQIQSAQGSSQSSGESQNIYPWGSGNSRN